MLTHSHDRIIHTYFPLFQFFLICRCHLQYLIGLERPSCFLQDLCISKMGVPITSFTLDFITLGSTLTVVISRSISGMFSVSIVVQYVFLEIYFTIMSFQEIGSQDPTNCYSVFFEFRPDFGQVCPQETNEDPVNLIIVDNINVLYPTYPNILVFR